MSDSQMIQDALNAASGSGGIVVLEPRTYVLEAPIRIPKFVTLQGSFRTPPTVWNGGTEIQARVPGGSDVGEPLIRLEGNNACLSGVRILYPEQVDPNQAPDVPLIPYPPTIQGGESDVCVQNVCLVNPWIGVDFASQPSGRHRIQGLNGQPLYIGIRVDKCLDVGRIENVHFWPFWNHAVPSYTQEHATALVIRKSDWQIVHNFFAWGYSVGIDLDASTDGSPNGQFSNINLDAVKVGIRCNHLQSVGAHFSNLNIASIPVGGGSFGEGHHHAIWSESDYYEGILAIRGGSFWGPGYYETAVVRWATSGAMLQISSSFFENWARGSGENRVDLPPAIYVKRGRAMIQGNYFNDQTGRAVYVGKEAERVMVTGNQLAGNVVKFHDEHPVHLRMEAHNHY